MKKTILSIAIAATLVSCSNKKPAEQVSATQSVNSSDTIGLSDFKEWKEKQEHLSSQQTFTSEGVNDPAPVTETKPAPVIIYREVPDKQPRVVKTSRPVSHHIDKEPSHDTENHGIAKAPAPESTGSKRESYGRGSTGTEGTGGTETTASNDGDVAVSTPAPAETPAKKDGWSKAAKGTAIGGASGAVLGAVLSKNKAKGAVIGGIVGAAGGYIFGRSKDKKDGRY